MRPIEDFRPKYKVEVAFSVTGLFLLATAILVRFTDLPGWLAFLAAALAIAVLVRWINAEKTSLDQRYFDYLSTIEIENVMAALSTADFSEISKGALMEYLNTERKKMITSKFNLSINTDSHASRLP